MNELAHPAIVSREEWLAKRKQLLEQEKEHTRAYDRINAQRRRLPMVKLEKDYTFEGPDGPVSLRDLFGDQQQLIVYHFMFDPSWDKGCPGCTGLVDALGDLSLLEKRRTRYVLISRAPLAKLDVYRKERGWEWPWYSSYGSDFNYDFHVTLDRTVVPLNYNFRDEKELEPFKDEMAVFHEGESHGLSVFFRVGEEVYHTYSTYGRGCEGLTNSYSLLDCTPYGRQEDFEDSPAGWPQEPTYG